MSNLQCYELLLFIVLVHMLYFFDFEKFWNHFELEICRCWRHLGETGLNLIACRILEAEQLGDGVVL